jgi:predicted nuclease of predicted toxin-antitoxin system
VSLRLLLDEQISAKVADQVRANDPSVSIQSVHHWRGGSLLGKDDGLLLAAAAEESLTLVTYDQKTLPTLLVEMALLGQSHGGVLFVDDRTIASNNTGALVKALLSLWLQCHGWDWTNRVMFLRPAG